MIAACLFGSRARGTAWAGSDLDIALLLGDDAPQGLALANQPAWLAVDIKRLGPFAQADLVVLNRQGIVFQHRVLRDGILLHESDAQPQRVVGLLLPQYPSGQTISSRVASPVPTTLRSNAA